MIFSFEKLKKKPYLVVGARTLIWFLMIFINIFISSIDCYAQADIRTKKIARAKDGIREVFEVCISNPLIEFKEKHDYHWVDLDSNIMMTKGGAGGDLLHGKYQSFDDMGGMRTERNFFIGLLHGNGRNWNEQGEIESSVVYEKGIVVYRKFKNSDEFVIEHIGEFLKTGWLKNVYSKYDKHLWSEELISPTVSKIKVYYENEPENILAEEYYSYLVGDIKTGVFKSFHKNGKIKSEGAYFDGEHLFDIMVGVWKWFDDTGNLVAEEQYKADVQYWSDDKLRSIGKFVYDDTQEKWVRDGEWREYSEQGKLISQTKYDLGKKQ